MIAIYINDINQVIVKDLIYLNTIVNYMWKMKKLRKLTNTRMPCVRCNPWMILTLAPLAPFTLFAPLHVLIWIRVVLDLWLKFWPFYLNV
jgi:hypothetical protein